MFSKRTFRLIAPASGTVQFAKALNRSVTGSMNDLVQASKWHLAEDEMAPHGVGFKLNETPLSALGFANSREAFRRLLSEGKPAGESKQ